MSPVVLSLVLACLPSWPETRTFEGPGVTLLQKVVEHGRVTLTMVEGPRRKRWHIRDFRGFHAPAFSADGRYVAEANIINEGTVDVIGPDGRLISYRPLELVSADELSVLSQTDCGPWWFAGLKFDGHKLVVLVHQVAVHPAERDPGPKLEITIDLVTGKLSRSTPPKVVTVASLLSEYRASPAGQQAAAAWLVRKALQEAPADRPVLLAFAREELPKTKDPEVQDALLIVLDQTGSDADRAWVAERALAAGWPPWRVLMTISRLPPEVRQAYARAVLDRGLGGANARVEAVRVLAAAPDSLKYLRLGLRDPARHVQDAALLELRHRPVDEGAFDFLLERASEPGARLALVRLFVLDEAGWRSKPLEARFEKECDGALRARWPGCEAWTGALADLREEAALAQQRYERALPAVTADLADGSMPSWSDARFQLQLTFLRLHVRLARLAKAAGRKEEVEAHLQALEQHPWWRSIGPACASGLPPGLVKCDSLRADELVSELRGQAKPH